jgi:cytochrome c biogenesis protein CcmG/thiol:disulfide interchange protein DsbE
MKRSLWALLLAIPLVALLASGFGRDPNVVASPLLNKPAPAFSLRTLAGKPLSLSGLRGHPVVLNFWASWCPPCKDEQPSMAAAWQYYQPQGVRFVGVEFRDTAPDLRAFLRRYGGGWPTLQDPGQQTAINYGVAGPPETFFIDRRGIVRYKVVGALSSAVLAQQIGRLLRMS